MIKDLFARYKNTDPTQRRSAGNIFKFLAVLLALTLIARGTSGATLARVELATPVRSEIIDAVFGTATVSATDFIEITVPEGLVITEMLVGVGQTVAIGEAIAVLGEVADRHIRETASLERMNLDLERLEREDNPDATAIENAKRNLDRARNDYNATVRQGMEDVANARSALEQLLDGSDMHLAAIRNYIRALNDFDAVYEQGRADVYAAENALADARLGVYSNDTAVQNAIRSHARVLEDFYATKDQSEADVAAAQDALYELLSRRPADHDRTAVENAQRSLTRAREDYTATVRIGEDNVLAAETALGNAWFNLIMSMEPSQALHNAVDAAQNALTNAIRTAESNRLSAARRLEDAEVSFAQTTRNFDAGIQAEIERAEASLETAKSRAADSLLLVTRRLEDAEITLAQAKQGLVERAETALETARNRAADSLLNATRRLEDVSITVDSEIERAYTALQNAITRAEDARQTAVRRVEDAIVSLNNAEATYERNVNQSADTAAQNTISASVLRLDISNQESVVSTLDFLMSNGGTLYSETVGVVASTMPQGSIAGRTPIVTLHDTSGGFNAQLNLPWADAEFLSIGSEATVTTGGGSIFFTPTTTGVVSSISQPDENDRANVSIALPAGNWNVGQRVDAQVVLSSANFDMSVPITAVHSDNAGYFIFVMEQRSTVLGVQNVVVRVNVTIVAADSEMAALRGPINRDTLVIVGSNKAITAGDRVRVSG